jgi:hypothetical protein
MTQDKTEGTTNRTTDHEVIRAWAEARGGVPAVVAGTPNDSDDESGVLRIEFRDQPDLQEVDWDRFFRIFDERQLEFVYQERTSDGQLSRFNKFIRRESSDSRTT